MRGLLAREPALFGVFVGALLTCAVQFGLPIDQTQANALTGVVVAGVTWWVRSSVISPATAVVVAEQAATRAVEAVDEVTAGATGVVTEAGQAAVGAAVAGALDTVSGVAGAAVGTLGGALGVLSEDEGGH